MKHPVCVYSNYTAAAVFLLADSDPEDLLLIAILAVDLSVLLDPKTSPFSPDLSFCLEASFFMSLVSTIFS